MATTESWRKTTLGQVTAGEASSLRTGPFGSQLHASDYVTEGVPVLMPRDFSGGTLHEDSLARVSEKKAAELANFRVRSGDVLLARRGEMGRCVCIQKSQDGWLCGTGVLRIRPAHNLDSRFLAYLLQSPQMVSWLSDHAVGQPLPSLNVRTLQRIPLQLPSIDEQRSIAGILAAVEQAIGKTQTVHARNRRLRARLWRQLLTEGPRRDSKLLGTVRPKDWPRQSVGSLCSLSNGFPFRTKDRSTSGLPIVRIKNLNGSQNFHYFGGHPSPNWTIEPGDLLFAWSGVKGSSFGPRLWQGPQAVLNQHIFRIRPHRGIAKAWLFEALKLVTHEIEAKAKGFKSDLLHIRKAELADHLVAVPPTEVQRRFSNLATSLAAIEKTEQESLNALIRLKRGLSQDLLSGRKRVLWV